MCIFKKSLALFISLVLAASVFACLGGLFVSAETSEETPVKNYQCEGCSVSLLPNSSDGELGLNVYVSGSDIPDTICCLNENGTKTSVTLRINSNGKYYQLRIPASKMTNVFTFYEEEYGPDDPLYTTSVREYVGKLLETDFKNDQEIGDVKYSDLLKRTLTAMLEYGRAAQIYFCEKSVCEHLGYGVCPGDIVMGDGTPAHTGDFADIFVSQKNIQDVLDNLRTDVDDIQIDGTTPEDSAKGQQGSEPAWLYGTSLVLGSTLSMKVYVQGAVTAGQQIFVNGTMYTLTHYSKDICSFTINNITLDKVGTLYKFKLYQSTSEEDGGNELQVSALGYIKRVVATYDGVGIGGHRASKNLRDLLLRLANFSKISDEYFRFVKAQSGITDDAGMGEQTMGEYDEPLD